MAVRYYDDAIIYKLKNGEREKCHKLLRIM